MCNLKLRNIQIKHPGVGGEFQILKVIYICDAEQIHINSIYK